MENGETNKKDRKNSHNMKELLDSLERVNSVDKLFDTCFILYEIEHNKGNKLEGGMTSFTAQELIHVMHKVKPELKLKARHFLKKCNLKIIEINVNPGNAEQERNFTETVDNELLKEVRDPSDAVLIATAIQKKIDKIYTRDKHHLYTTELENYLQKYGITVYNTI